MSVLPSREFGTNPDVLAQRWLNQLYSGNENPDITRLVGVVSIGTEALPVFETEEGLFSERGFEETDSLPRVVAPVGLGLYTAEQIPKNGRGFQYVHPTSLTGRLLSNNTTPMTLRADKDTTASGLVLFQNRAECAPNQVRTGFLGKKNDGIAQPLFLMVDGIPHLVEIKGAGHAEGGFDFSRNGVFENVVFGGLPYSDAEKEFNILTAANVRGLTPIIPLALGRFSIRDAASDLEHDLGVVYRLTPSTMRLSYKGTTASVPFETAADSTGVVSMLVDNFLSKFFKGTDDPIYLSQASHLENYLVSDGFKITETDFEDFRQLGETGVPFVHKQTGNFIDMKKIVQHYFVNFMRVPGFDTEQGHREIATMLTSKLSEAGIDIDFNDCETIFEVAGKLWQQWILPFDYAARLKVEYSPTAMVNFADENAEAVHNIATELDSPRARYDAYNDLEKKYGHIEGVKELLDIGSKFLILYHDEQVPNNQRSRLADSLNELLLAKAQEIYQAEPFDLDVTGAVREVLEATRKEYVFVVRTYSAIDFAAEYLESELEYLAAAEERRIGGVGLAVLREHLEKRLAPLKYIGESSDFRIATRYQAQILPVILRNVQNAISEYYSKNAQPA